MAQRARLSRTRSELSKAAVQNLKMEYNIVAEYVFTKKNLQLTYLVRMNLLLSYKKPSNLRMKNMTNRSKKNSPPSLSGIQRGAQPSTPKTLPVEKIKRTFGHERDEPCVRLKNTNHTLQSENDHIHTWTIYVCAGTTNKFTAASLLFPTDDGGPTTATLKSKPCYLPA